MDDRFAAHEGLLGGHTVRDYEPLRSDGLHRSGLSAHAKNSVAGRSGTAHNHAADVATGTRDRYLQDTGSTSRK